MSRLSGPPGDAHARRCLLPLLALIFTLLPSMTGSLTASARADSPGGARQVVLVVADSWDARRGTMSLYDRTASGWSQSGPSIQVELGKNGLGWGAGFADEPGGGPVKREGDGKAPAGIFPLGFAFGYDEKPFRPLALPYRCMTDSFECVDDPASSRYNSVLDARGIPEKDWKSSETMRRKDGQYALGVVVEYNTRPASPGAGSCIFLHVRSAPGAYTSGCTAMSLADLRRVVSWLDASRSPVLVQIPAFERERFRNLHGTP